MSATILQFPRSRTRRFLAVEQVGRNRYRAASFIGWHPDPRIRPDRVVETYGEALARVRYTGKKLGVPVIVDRILYRGAVWDGAA